jgi:hypothetical protein
MQPARAHDISVEAIEHMLASRLETLVRELLPDGERRGAEWVALNPGRADARLGSLSVNVHTGRWADFAADKRGSRTMPCLSLVATFATEGRWKTEGPSRPGAIRWARDWLGLTDRNAPRARVQAIEEEAAKALAKRTKELKLAAEKKRCAAQAMWLAAKPLDGHDPASLYLAARGIDVHALGEIPGALRWSHEVRHYTAQDEYTDETGMLAAMHLEGAPNGFAAVHRTFLRQERGGRWWKAFGKDSKTILGPKAGATIRLAKGYSAKPLARAPEGERVLVSEGIENALSAAIVMPAARVLAAGTLENIAKIALPKQIATVGVCADNDKPDGEAARALDRATERLAERGYDIEILRAPPGFKDFNAVLMGERQAA